MIDFTSRGRRIRKVIGASKREAEAAAIAIKSDIIRDQYKLARPKKQILFKTFAKDDYLELHAKQNKRSWTRDEASIKHLSAYFKKHTLTSITPDLIERYKAKRKEAEAAPATINRELTCLKGIFTKAIEWGKAETNPVKKVKLLKELNQKERILTDKEMKRLIDVASPGLKPILILALNTGMRKGEMLKLKWTAVNFSKGYILIEDGKGGKSRKIPLNFTVKQALSEIKRASDYVFCNPETGKHLVDINTSFKTACDRAKITELRIHDLRHTAATKMIERGIDLVTVSKILGHSTIQMTMRYAHPTPENMQRAVDKLSEIFEDELQKSRHKVDTLGIRGKVPSSSKEHVSSLKSSH